MLLIMNVEYLNCVFRSSFLGDFLLFLGNFNLNCNFFFLDDRLLLFFKLFLLLLVFSKLLFRIEVKLLLFKLIHNLVHKLFILFHLFLLLSRSGKSSLDLLLEFFTEFVSWLY